MSKAQELRNKQLRNTLTANVSRLLIDFKNQYLTDYRNFHFGQEVKVKAQAERLLADPEALQQYAGDRKYRQVEMCKRDLLQRILRINTLLDRTALFDLEKYNEANTSFQTKFDNLINKLVHEEMDTRMLRVEKVGGGTFNKFSILISNDDVEVEARFIYAQGLTNAPHYRFIITKRTK
tara:strand:- start:34 stop:570 length:537 start_codon:yes stop_codon:yes gene_type:complete